MTTPSVKMLIGEVAKRHGITLKPDDPAFALVTLNQLVLEHTMAGLTEQAQSAAREISEGISLLQTKTGNLLGAEVRNAASQIRETFDKAAGSSGQMPGHGPTESGLAISGIRWLAVGLVAGLVSFVLGVFTGHFWK